jgi:hypothetical protein
VIKWTEEKKEYVRVHYQGTNASKAIIAAALGVTPGAVGAQVHILGVAKLTGRVNWLSGEDDRLRELVSQFPLSSVAKMMGRSLGSVKNRTVRLGLSLRSRDGWYVKTEVAEILGVDHKRVQSYIDSGALKASYHNGRKPHQSGNDSWHISDAALRAFIVRYCHEFNGRNVNLVMITDLLAGLNYRGPRGAGDKDYA